MAVSRGMQLKVYNHWTGGLENKVEEHLIRDISFTKAINLDNSTGSIRPIRSHREVETLLNDTVKIASEHIIDCTKLLQFNESVQFVNYGDTVYYVSTEGGELKQFHKESGDCDNLVQSYSTYVTLTGALEAGTNASVLDDVFSQLLQTVYSYYTSYKNDRFDDYIYYSSDPSVTLGVMENYFNIEITRLFNLFISHDTVTEDNLATLIGEKDAERLELVSFLTTRTTEMAGIINQRLLTLRNANLDLRKFFNDKTEDRKYKSQYLDIYTGTREQAYGWVFNFLIHNSEVFQMLDAIEQDSISNYIMFDTTQINTSGDTVLQVREPLVNLVKRLRGYLISLLDAYTQAYVDNGGADPFPESSQDASINTDVYNLTINAIGVEEAKLLYYAFKAISFHDTSLGVNGLHADTYAETSYRDLRDYLINMRDSIANIDLVKEANAKIYKLAVVGHNTKTGAYSNVIESNLVYYDGNLISVSGWQVDANLDELVFYRKTLSDEAYYQEIHRSGFTLDPISLDLSVDAGGVIGYRYQTESPPRELIGLTEHQGVLFMIEKNSQKVYFSEKGYPSRLSSLNYINAPQNTVAIVSNGAGVLVWTTNRTVHLITVGAGETKDTIAIKQIAENVGILDSKAKVVVDNNVVWLSRYGFHNTSGYGSANVTKTYWIPPDDLVKSDILDMLVIDQDVYVLYKYGVVTKLIKYTNYTTSILEYEVNNLLSLAEVDGTLYGVTAEHKEVQLFKGNELVAYDVNLKRFAGYSFDVRQRFLGFMVAHDNKPYSDIERAELSTIATVYIDCREVGSKMLIGCDTTEVELPNNNNVGYSIHINFRGSLKIHSVRIKYTTHQWED